MAKKKYSKTGLGGKNSPAGGKRDLIRKSSKMGTRAANKVGGILVKGKPAKIKSKKVNIKKINDKQEKDQKLRSDRAKSKKFNNYPKRKK